MTRRLIRLSLSVMVWGALAGCGQRDALMQARGEIDDLRARVRKLERASADRERRLHEGLRRLRRIDTGKADRQKAEMPPPLLEPADRGAEEAEQQLDGTPTADAVKKLTETQEQLVSALAEFSAAQQRMVGVMSDQWADVVAVLAALPFPEGQEGVREGMLQLAADTDTRIRLIMGDEQWQRFRAARPRRPGQRP